MTLLAAGIIHQDIQTAQLLHGVIDHRLTKRLTANVARQCDGFASG